MRSSEETAFRKRLRKAIDAVRDAFNLGSEAREFNELMFAEILMDRARYSLELQRDCVSDCDKRSISIAITELENAMLRTRIAQGDIRWDRGEGIVDR